MEPSKVCRILPISSHRRRRRPRWRARQHAVPARCGTSQRSTTRAKRWSARLIRQDDSTSQRPRSAEAPQGLRIHFLIIEYLRGKLWLAVKMLLVPQSSSGNNRPRKRNLDWLVFFSSHSFRCPQTILPCACVRSKFREMLTSCVYHLFSHIFLTYTSIYIFSAMNHMLFLLSSLCFYCTSYWNPFFAAYRDHSLDCRGRPVL